MSRLCFGTYAKTLQIALQEPNDNQAVAELLLGLIVTQETITNKKGDPIQITPKMVSRLFNFAQNIQKNIMNASASPKVIKIAHSYFSRSVVPCLNPHKREDLLAKLIDL